MNLSFPFPDIPGCDIPSAGQACAVERVEQTFTSSVVRIRWLREEAGSRSGVFWSEQIWDAVYALQLRKCHRRCRPWKQAKAYHLSCLLKVCGASKLVPNVVLLHESKEPQLFVVDCSFFHYLAIIWLRKSIAIASWILSSVLQGNACVYVQCLGNNWS